MLLYFNICLKIVQQTANKIDYNLWLRKQYWFVSEIYMIFANIGFIGPLLHTSKTQAAAFFHFLVHFCIDYTHDLLTHGFVKCLPRFQM